MVLKDLKIGFGITGSFCTFSKVPPLIESLINEGANVLPIFSHNSQKFDTRFGVASEFIDKIETLTGNKIIKSIPEAEPIGPKNLIDLMIIFPCTGNTLSKLANAITDTPVLMATKSHLRNNKPVVIGISTNDGLSNSAKNIGTLLNMKNIFFIPFGQDDPEKKANSLICKPEYAIDTIKKALEYKQLQPLLV